MKKQSNIHKYTAWFGSVSTGTYHKYEARDYNLKTFIQKLLYYNSSAEIWDRFVSLNLEGLSNESIILLTNTIIEPYCFIKIQDNGKTIFVKE